MFTSKHRFRTVDSWESRPKVWRCVNHLIPPDKVLYEPFDPSGSGGAILRALGHTVISSSTDFFSTEPQGDITVTNPPFSITKDVLTHLKAQGRPFIVILPLFKIITVAVRELFRNDPEYQLVFPRGRFEFLPGSDSAGTVNKRCSFDCCYIFYKIKLKHDITYL